MSVVLNRFRSLVSKSLPQLSEEHLVKLISANLIASQPIRLSKAIFSQAKEFIDAINDLISLPSYKASQQHHLDQLRILDQGQRSLANSFDFHLTTQGELRLIEINTNAAFLGLSELLYAAHNLPIPKTTDLGPLDSFTSDLLVECSAKGLKKKGSLKIAIVDENPSEQKLFIEFLVYQAHLNRSGHHCDILDFRENLNSYDFIYNRWTDFYFQKSDSRALKDLFHSPDHCVSPNPVEYALLADKSRLIEWSLPENLKAWGLSEENSHSISRYLSKTLHLNSANQEEVWKNRKFLFFKPAASFGSKQSYRGESISRKNFEFAVQNHFVAQELVRAPEVDIEIYSPHSPAPETQKFKYDLRFYTYGNRIESVVARLYQGQVTNLQTPGGGFAPVIFSELGPVSS